MATGGGRPILRHTAVLHRGFVRGRQVSCKITDQDVVVSARCSVRYCGKEITLTLVYSCQRDATGEEWQVDACPDVDAFADIAASPYSFLTVADLANWTIADPSSSLALLSIFLTRLSAEMHRQLSDIDNPRY